MFLRCISSTRTREGRVGSSAVSVPGTVFWTEIPMTFPIFSASFFRPFLLFLSIRVPSWGCSGALHLSLLPSSANHQVLSITSLSGFSFQSKLSSAVPVQQWFSSWGTSPPVGAWQHGAHRMKGSRPFPARLKPFPGLNRVLHPRITNPAPTLASDTLEFKNAKYDTVI